MSYVICWMLNKGRVTGRWHDGSMGWVALIASLLSFAFFALLKLEWCGRSALLWCLQPWSTRIMARYLNVDCWWFWQLMMVDGGVSGYYGSCHHKFKWFGVWRMLLVDWEVRVNMVTWDSSQADHDFGGVVMGGHDGHGIFSINHDLLMLIKLWMFVGVGALLPLLAVLFVASCWVGGSSHGHGIGMNPDHDFGGVVIGHMG